MSVFLQPLRSEGNGIGDKMVCVYWVDVDLIGRLRFDLRGVRWCGPLDECVELYFIGGSIY